MRQVSIVRRLNARYRRLLIGGIVVFPLVAFVVVGVGQIELDLLISCSRVDLAVSGVIFLVLVSALLLVWVLAVGNALRKVLYPDSHPDLLRLARYGPLPNLLHAIETELADQTQVRCIGQPVGWLGSLFEETHGDLDNSMVCLTPSWLIQVTEDGDRIMFFRLDSVVQAGLRDGAVVVIDQHKKQREITGAPRSVLRLLTEILRRAPGAVNPYDSSTGKTWKQNRDQIIAQVSQLGEEQSASRQTPEAEQVGPEYPDT
jgi:hypothetical protein